MYKRKNVIFGLFGAAVLAAIPFCMDYGNDGWRILRWHTGLKRSSPEVKNPNRYAEATTEKLGTVGFHWHDTRAIYELGRRGARQFESQMKTAAEGPPWEASNGTDPNRARKYGTRAAALAVLAKWKVLGAEEELLRGASASPDLEGIFVPALAYVNSTASVRQLEMYKGYKLGLWKCSRASNNELGCSWTGLQF